MLLLDREMPVKLTAVSKSSSQLPPQPSFMGTLRKAGVLAAAWPRDVEPIIFIGGGKRGPCTLNREEIGDLAERAKSKAHHEGGE